MASSDIHKLTTLVKRLEAVTLRLEDLFTTPDTINSATTSTELKTELLDVIHSSLAFTTRNLEPQPTQDNAHESLPGSIERFDEFLDTSVSRYVQLSKELGGAVARQAQGVHFSFQEQRKFLVTASKTPKPDATGLQRMLRPTHDIASQVVAIQGACRGNVAYNHLSCVADGIPVLGWVAIEMNAFRHVDKFLDTVQYFGNKVTAEFKDKNPKHLEWVQSYYQIFRALSALIKEHFRSGISWRIGS
ncbi:adenylate cyclase-associated CAP [Truncatella angustata]|uniref:Adenylyl cyclase-associated protein n=1 Tax=Truncatella angustata TaxID=152316 RepID=A0A9P8RG31_9PEZI|nr:adenylate cyclase-associated CAP [Truncatella angustata]KAH6645179.1 adenylate cyclase-associated CAP [Truncatella angustata]